MTIITTLETIQDIEEMLEYNAHLVVSFLFCIFVSLIN